MHRRAHVLLTALFAISVSGAGLMLTSCHSPEGGFMSFTGGSHTYESDEFSPKTVVLIDLRSNETIFTMDVPPGKQLSLDFVAGEGDDPVYTPDLMRWEVWDAGTRMGKMRNSMSVPNAASRRLDLFVRQGPEYAPVPPEEALRVDQVANRPEYWTPRGGPVPDEPDGHRSYED